MWRAVIPEKVALVIQVIIHHASYPWFNMSHTSVHLLVLLSFFNAGKHLLSLLRSPCVRVCSPWGSVQSAAPIHRRLAVGLRTADPQGNIDPSHFDVEFSRHVLGGRMCVAVFYDRFCRFIFVLFSFHLGGGFCTSLQSSGLSNELDGNAYRRSAG